MLAGGLLGLLASIVLAGLAARGVRATEAVAGRVGEGNPEPQAPHSGMIDLRSIQVIAESVPLLLTQSARDRAQGR